MPPRAAVAPPPGPADVGAIAALPIELAPFRAALRHVRKYTLPRHTIIEGTCGGKLVVALTSGIGRGAARTAAELLLDGHRPRWLIAAGFAGALHPDWRRNDVVLVEQVAHEANASPVFHIDVGVAERDAGITAGRLLTVDRIIRTAAEKAELRARFAADLVDMESHAVAAVCAERGVRFLGVRVISDEAATDLPPEVLSILGPTGGFRLGAAVGAIWKRPGSVKQLWVLREQAHEAAERLGRVLPGILERLP